MTTALTDGDIPRELEPVAERGLGEHLRRAEARYPHDYVWWDDGRDFAAPGEIDGEPGRSRLSEVTRTTMVTNLLTEDNLLCYRREISEFFSLDGVRGTPMDRSEKKLDRMAARPAERAAPVV
ncbi:hypothetical protein [Nocardia sp. NPDC050710]|uniref:hypothetical protein n=1 Tax=Nocardia sp. NPDC050710 TaxID=3157220 RepID=UPI0033DD01BA